MKNLFLIIIVSLVFLASCEKEIYLELPQPDSKYVVEGWIENGEYPVVIVSRNSEYFATVDTAYLADSLLITDALVIVSNGVIDDTLQPKFSMENFMNQVWPIFYYEGSKFTGQLYEYYTLRIEIGDDVITGSTTIPEPHGFDTIWWEPEQNLDTLGYIWARFTDPAAEKNYYRIFTKRLGRDYIDVPIFGSVYDDVYFAGESITFSMFRGINSYEDDSSYVDPEFGYWKKGDTVLVRISSIDNAHYDFWMSIEQEVMSGGNPFANPTTIRHTVEGAAGVFGGYGSVYDTLIIQ